LRTDVPSRPLVRFDAQFSIGYFWNIISGDKLKGTCYAHHGGVPRSQRYICIVTKYNLGEFTITNQSGDRTAHAMEEALDTLIGKIAERETSTASERKAAADALEHAH
jgi:hypothetical protein